MIAEKTTLEPSAARVTARDTLVQDAMHPGVVTYSPTHRSRPSRAAHVIVIDLATGRPMGVLSTLDVAGVLAGIRP